MNATNIRLLSTPAIVTLFNNLAENHATDEVAKVKKFSDRTTAQKRTLALLEKTGMEIVKVEGGVPTLAPAGKPWTSDADIEASRQMVENDGPVAPTSDTKDLDPPAKKERKRRGFRFVFPKKDEIKTARPGSKRAKVVELLSRPEGATLAEIMAETGWSEKDAYEGTRLVHFYLGHGMTQDEQGRVRLK